MGGSRQSADLPKVKSPLRVEIESGYTMDRTGPAPPFRAMLLDQEGAITAPRRNWLAGLFCECLFHFGDPDGPI